MMYTYVHMFMCINMITGDVLYIPALWFHNVVSLDFSVAVNVFWRRLAPDMYDAKDTYGNKDPLPVCFQLALQHAVFSTCTATRCNALQFTATHCKMRIYAYMYLCIYIYTYIYIHSHMNTHVFIYISAYTYKHTHTHSHPHSHPHTHKHTQANRAMQQVGTMLKTLESLPPVERDFFARRIVQVEILQHQLAIKTAKQNDCKADLCKCLTAHQR